MSKVTVVDYGMGNVGSIVNMIAKVGGDSCVSSDPDVIRNASKLILPGVGAFDNAIANLKERCLLEPLTEAVLNRGVFVLGICLGMQILFERSEEGCLPGLGWIGGEVKKFRLENTGLKVPHMGWNTVEIRNKDSRLMHGFERQPRFYFVHSYYAECTNYSDVLAECDYGAVFTAAVEHENIFGTQFHPEKSHKFGMKLIENFVALGEKKLEYVA